MNDDEKRVHGLLRLLSVPGIGPNRIRRLIAHFQSPMAIFSADLLALTAIDGIDKILAENILKKNEVKFADEQMQICHRQNIQIITFYDKQYPPQLKEISDPPILLFSKGNFLPADYVSLGVVGTRLPSDYGRLATERFVRDLVQKGFTIVSGLARGVDTLAHQTCLKQGGRTIAILGSGLDVIYPSENKKLAQNVSEHGVLVTEMPCGSQPDAVNFPKRNRIISGCSLGVLIVEAGEKSGALITAISALEQNREVFAVPGTIFSTKSVGTNRLIKEGAKLVQSVDDILDELVGKIRAFSLEKPGFKPAPKEISDKEKRILDILTEQPAHIDLISQQTGFSIAETLSLLLTLELKDLVKQLSGKMFVRC